MEDHECIFGYGLGVKDPSFGVQPALHVAYYVLRPDVVGDEPCTLQ